MKSGRHPSIDWRIVAAAAVGFGIQAASAQVATTVGVNFNAPITYANGAAVAIMPSTGLGLGASVYANQWGNAALPGLISAAGTQMIRYPGGSYSDIYNWSLGTANDGGYVAANSSFGNYIKVLDASGTQGIVTVNYGSDSTGTIGAQPQEAAAEVAYADASSTILGTPTDVMLGDDAAGVNWETAGFWAKLRASTPSQYQTWATAAGDYNPAYSFLAINHPAPENIQYWEIGNEIGGNGYNGAQWEYDLHAPYNNGNTSDNTGRVGNPLLSPTAYANNLNQFATLMKQVDPSIKIGAGFDASANNTEDAAILQTAGNNIDFGIIHWYPTGSLPKMVYSGSGSIPTEITNLRNNVAANTTKGVNGIQILVTEFANGNSSATPIQKSLFAADAYATGMENGVQNMDFQEMSSPDYLGDSNPLTPGVVYYATQMLSDFASAGDTFVSTSYSDSMLRVHAVEKPDGSIALLVINDGVGTSQNRTLTVNLSNEYPLTTAGTLYLYGNSNITGTTTTAPTSQILTGVGASITLGIPNQTIGTFVLPALWLSWDNAGATGTGINWDASTQNWNNGSAPATFVSNVNVNFNDTNNSHYAVTLNTPVTPHLITINNSSGNYVISGTGSIGGGASLTKMGTSTATLDTVNTYTGGTTVSAGALVIGVNGALPNSPVNITGGTLQLGTSTGLATIPSLAISGNGTLDVNNNHVIINYGAGADPISSIAALLVTGRNNGAWNGPGGIVSTAAAANPGTYALGYADSADPGNPAGLAPDTIEIEYTLAGDANLDGIVSGNDFTILAGNLGKAVSRWDQGDFDYDGTVTGTDFTALVGNLGKSATGASVEIPAADFAAVNAFAAANGLMADVPEPTTGSLTFIAAAAILATRRRSPKPQE